MGLQVYSTLTRKKEPFQTVEPGKVGMYVCGPTVYKPSHIGHMVGPVIFDTIKRYLTYIGYEVHFIVNITDVDDKLIARASELGTSVSELAGKMTQDYRWCLEQLNVTTIDRMPKATEHIAEMIAMMQRLIEKGYAYAADGDVYFDIMKDDDYGKLCNRDPEQLEAGSRIEVSVRKRNPGDFALWKAAKPGEPAWDSPWGRGRPGWHIECSAMSMKYLGETLDIHGGGLDLQFPHHENELAQSESYSDKPFAKYWLHNGLLRMGDQKMAGSVGNVVNIMDLLQQQTPETVRFLLLNTHYRSPIEYSEKRFEELSKGLERYFSFFQRVTRVTGKDFYTLPAPTQQAPMETRGAYPEFLNEIRRLRDLFLANMEDDFNTGGAIGVMYEMLSSLNRFADAQKLEQPDASAEAKTDFLKGITVLRELTNILGLFWKPMTPAKGADDGLVDGLMQLLIDLRAEARKAKNFAVADQIRNRLKELGVVLEDRPTGTDWQRE